MTKRTIWTDSETALAREMLDRDAPDAEFMPALGRTKNATRARINRVNFRATMWSPEGKFVPYTKVPPHVAEDRIARQSAVKSLTASLMGDPEPMRSALARKQGVSA